MRAGERLLELDTDEGNVSLDVRIGDRPVNKEGSLLSDAESVGTEAVRTLGP